MHDCEQHNIPKDLKVPVLFCLNGWILFRSEEVESVGEKYPMYMYMYMYLLLCMCIVHSCTHVVKVRALHYTQNHSPTSWVILLNAIILCIYKKNITVKGCRDTVPKV